LAKQLGIAWYLLILEHKKDDNLFGQNLAREKTKTKL
jgi:hypothetical protein